MSYHTIEVEQDGNVRYLRFARPQAGNTINDVMIGECREALQSSPSATTVVVLQGSPEVFCLGADFNGMPSAPGDAPSSGSAQGIFDLWSLLASAPFVSVAFVRGKANAGGIGFVAASDIVLADQSAQFSLSEMLFGLFPACVLPFLVRRIGFQRAHYLTLSTQTIQSPQAHAWGLVDAYDTNGELLLKKHLLRLRTLSKTAIGRYKRYAATLHPIGDGKAAIAANHEVFTDAENLQGILRYTRTGQLPWEQA